MSRTIQIPGGTAELFDQDELTPARRIPITAFRYRYRDLFAEVASASIVESPTGDVETNPSLQGAPKRLTQEEAEVLQHYQFIITFGWLKSWTIKHPFPEDWKDLLNAPLNVVDALDAAVNAGAGRDPSGDVAEGFELSKETLENKESFTGGSDASKTSSKAPAKRRSSTRKTSTT